MAAVSEDTREAITYLFQWLSVALQREMRSPSTALSPKYRSPPSKRHCGLTCLIFDILPSGIE